MHRPDGERATPGWLLHELANAGRENLDAAHVARYDGKTDARGAEEVELLRSHGLGASSVGDEHSTFSWLLEAMFDRTGFVIEVADYSDDGFDARYVLRTKSQSTSSESAGVAGRTTM
jgi:hypothetical protein